MTKERPNRDRVRLDDWFEDDYGRRTFLAVGGGIGATMLAGCTSEHLPDEPSNDTAMNGSAGSDHDGNFRLLVSDLPADIGDFDRLNVTFDYARVFGGDEDEEPDEDDEQPADGNETDDEGEPENDDEDEEEEEPADGVERKDGFYIVDLEDATVDLTAVIGEKAVPVFEGELSPGTYEKIELHVSDVEGVVDGEQASVKVPSGKLQITHSFEITDDGSVGFVFDINVVKRGRKNAYNLNPVISESGIAGEDVEVEEIDDEDDGEDEEDDGGDDEDEEEDEEDEEDEDEEGNGKPGGPPENPGKANE